MCAQVDWCHEMDDLMCVRVPYNITDRDTDIYNELYPLHKQVIRAPVSCNFLHIVDTAPDRDEFTWTRAPEAEDRMELEATQAEAADFIDEVSKLPYLPSETPETIIQALDLPSREPEVRPYIKDLFVKRHPKLVSTNPLYSGNCSKTLSHMYLCLKDGAQQPHMHRMVQHGKVETSTLKDILVFLQMGQIKKVSMEEMLKNPHKCGVIAYLVRRPGSSQKFPRLVIDMSEVNDLFACGPELVPTKLQSYVAQTSIPRWTFLKDFIA